MTELEEPDLTDARGVRSPDTRRAAYRGYAKETRSGASGHPQRLVHLLAQKQLEN